MQEARAEETETSLSAGRQQQELVLDSLRGASQVAPQQSLQPSQQHTATTPHQEPAAQLVWMSVLTILKFVPCVRPPGFVSKKASPVTSLCFNMDIVHNADGKDNFPLKSLLVLDDLDAAMSVCVSSICGAICMLPAQSTSSQWLA